MAGQAEVSLHCPTCMPNARELSQLCGCGVLIALCIGLGPGRAETPLTDNSLKRIEMIQAEAQGLQRAVNVGRETATKLNGGLRVYRPASCMYETASKNPCLITNDNNGFTFRFLGGAPGWQQLNLPPTVETEIRISRDGRTVLGIDYNGAPR